MGREDGSKRAEAAECINAAPHTDGRSDMFRLGPIAGLLLVAASSSTGGLVPLDNIPASGGMEARGGAGDLEGRRAGDGLPDGAFRPPGGRRMGGGGAGNGVGLLNILARLASLYPDDVDDPRDVDGGSIVERRPCRPDGNGSILCRIQQKKVSHTV